MVFMTSLADFGTPMLIGEGYMVLPVLVYNEYMSEIGGKRSPGKCSFRCSCILFYYRSFSAETFCYKEELRNDSYASAKGRTASRSKTLPGDLPGYADHIYWYPSSDRGYCQQTLSRVTLQDLRRASAWEAILRSSTVCGTNIRNTFVFSTIAIVFIIIIGMLISYIVVRQKGFAGQLMDLLIMFPFVILELFLVSA